MSMVFLFAGIKVMTRFINCAGYDTFKSFKTLGTDDQLSTAQHYFGFCAPVPTFGVAFQNAIFNN